MLVNGVLDPLGQHRINLVVCPGATLLDIVQASLTDLAARMGEKVESYAWFFKVGVVKVNGLIFRPSEWKHCRAKSSKAQIELCVPETGKGKAGRVLLVLAAVALTVATGFIAAGGLFTAFGFGTAATLGGGSLGANLVASTLGVAGSLLLNALTPAPAIPAPEGQRQLSQAGITGNPITVGSMISSVAGRIRVSPQIVYPQYTTLNDDVVTVHGMVAVEGDCVVEDIRINDIAIGDVPGARWEVKQGDGTSADTYLSSVFQIQNRQSIGLSNYELKDEQNQHTYLKDAVTPSNSYSKYHMLAQKKADSDRYIIRLLAEAGIANSQGDDCGLPFRIDIRKVGTSQWRALPTFHMQDNKGLGPFQQEVQLVFGAPERGFWVSRNDSLNTNAVLWKTGPNQVFEWQSDPYFTPLSAPPQPYNPVMSGYTLGVVSVSASSEFSAANQAWRACDASATEWGPLDNALPATWTIDLGAINANTIRSYSIQKTFDAEYPAEWYLDGSNDNLVWDRLDHHNVDEFGVYFDNIQVKKSGVYRYYRFTFLRNRGAPNNRLRVNQISMLLEDFPGAGLVTSTARGTSFGNLAARYININSSGARVYLRSEDWPAGAYDVRVRRGFAYQKGRMSFDSLISGATDVYAYDSNNGKACFFDVQPGASPPQISIAQNDVQSKTSVIATTNCYPFRAIEPETESRLTRIAVSIPNLEVQSVSALVTGKAREYMGQGQWGDAYVPSRNPAAYLRDALLLSKKPELTVSEVVDGDSMIEYWNHCVANNHTIDAIVGNIFTHDFCVLCASVGRASLRYGFEFGVSIDHDRSAESHVKLLTPENSNPGGTEIVYDNIPHGLRFSFYDETDSYKQKDGFVYRPGYDAMSATEIEALPVYEGHTSFSKAAAQATYDLRQLLYRNKKMIRDVPLVGISFAKGDLLAIADDSISRNVFYGLIKNVLKSGGNVIGFELLGSMALSDSVSQITAIGDVSSVGDINTATAVFGACVEKTSGGTFTAAISNTANTDVVMLTVPVADVGQFSPNLTIAVGPLNRVVERVVVQKVEHIGGEDFRVTCLPVGDEIFA